VAADIRIEVSNIVKRLKEMEYHYGREIKEKVIFRRAGKVVKDTLKQDTPVDKGNLKASADYLNFRKDKNGLYVGNRYGSRKDIEGNNLKPIGPHAHLVEFGFIDRAGNRVEGNPIVKNTYEKTRLKVLANLENELIKLQKRFERTL
jgi:hypothetical protein